MTGITPTLSLTPALVPRLCAVLQKSQGPWQLSRIGNTGTPPRQRQRLQNYTALTQGVVARLTASMPSTQPAPVAGQRRLCPFTALPLGTNGRFSAADSAAYIGRQPRRPQSLSTPENVGKGAGAARPAAVPGMPPRIVQSAGASTGAGTAGSGAGNAATAALITTPAKAQPIDPSISSEVASVLPRIASVRNMWRSGMFVEAPRPLLSSLAATQRIQAEIAAARNAFI